MHTFGVTITGHNEGNVSLWVQTDMNAEELAVRIRETFDNER